MERRDLVGREPYAALLFVLETSQAAAVASLLTEALFPSMVTQSTLLTPTLV